MSRNFASPYAKPMQQYPSQSEDYISLEFGGPGKCSTPARPQYQNNRGNESGNFYQNRGRGNQHNRISGGWNSNRKSFGNYAEYGQWQPRQSYGRSEILRSTPNHRQNNKQPYHKNNDISTYFHPSMLEDPWKELMERRNAIKRSEINLQTPANQIQENDVIRDTVVGTVGAEESEESGSDMDDAT